MMSEPKRWTARISYRSDHPTEVVLVEEIADLHDIVEHGPHWNKIDEIVITYNRSEEPGKILN